MSQPIATGPIGDCLAGVISPEVAVARLLLGGATASDIEASLEAQRSASPRWAAMAGLVGARTAALDALAAEVQATAAQHDASGTTPEAGLARIAAFFDHAVRHSPEASVALYSLGDPAILAAATAEIVDWLEGQGLLRPGLDVLDLGCGIGRVAAALAPRCRSVLGLDVSPGMVAEAARRHGVLANVRFQHTAGRDLDALPPAAFDLVLAIDSFPYIVQTGPETADRHVAGAARALRAGGALVVLNLSYRNDAVQDHADASGWAAAHGYALEVAGVVPFKVWDGTAWVLRLPAPSPSGRGGQLCPCSSSPSSHPTPKRRTTAAARCACLPTRPLEPSTRRSTTLPSTGNCSPWPTTA